MKRSVIIQSCNGGGPMERLARRLTTVGRPSVVDSLYSGSEWMQLMSSGSAGRIRARLGAFVWFPLKALWTAVRQRDAIVVSTTNPFFLPGFMTATRALHRSPVVALVYDLWPDAAEASGALSSDSKLAMLALRFNQWWLHRCDGVVFIGPNMAIRIEERYGRPSRSAIIETGADVEEFLAATDDEPGDTELDRWLEKGPVASYVGNMGAMHDVDTLAEAVRLLNSGTTEHNTRVLVAASGPGPELLRRAWADLDERMVRFEAPLPDDQWRRVLVHSDIAIVTLRSEAAHTSLPSKAFSAMAAGSALLAVAPSHSDLAECVQDCGAGTVVAPGDAVGLAGALLSYHDDLKLLGQHQAMATHAARHRYDMPALADRWENLLASLD